MCVWKKQRVGKDGTVWSCQGDEKPGVTKERRIAGDTWSKSRSERGAPEAVQEDAHDHHRLQLLHKRHKYTQLSGPDRDHSQNTLLLLLHPSLPWVSLTPFFPRTHPRGAGRGGREAACCPCGLWRIITQHYALKSNSQLPAF